MSPFIVNPHGRLQEWIADEKDYLEQASFENYTLLSHALITKNSTKKIYASQYVEDNKDGAYQTYAKGWEVSISCACHWTVNMAASDNHGKLWGYKV